MNNRLLILCSIMLLAGISILTAGNSSAILTADNPNIGNQSLGSFNQTDSKSGDVLLLVPPPNDECVNAQLISGPFPVDVFGTTVEATLDCPDGFGEAAVWYRFTAPYAHNTVTLDYCQTSDDIDYAAFFMYDGCPADDNICSDYIEAYQAYDINCDGGGRKPFRRWVSLPGPAEYYFPVYFDLQTPFGFEIMVTEFTPVDLTCPGGAVIEAEFCGDDDNGGCLMAPGTEAFESLQCGETVCGTYWSNYYQRDLDWYEITLAEPGFIDWMATGESPTRIWVYNGTGGCDGVFLGSAAADPGETATLSLEVSAGTYWLVVGPDGWFDMPCGGSGMFTNDYYAEVNCELGTPVLSVNPTEIFGEALEGFNDLAILTVDNTGTGRMVFVAEATENVILTANVGQGAGALDSDIENWDQILSPYAPQNPDQLYDNIPEITEALQKQNEMDDLPVALIDCPPEATVESESCGDDSNNGCALTPGSESFEAINCNGSVCGTVWSDGNIRDIDWYTLQLTEPSMLVFSVTADFPHLIFIIEPGQGGNVCDGYQVLYFDTDVAGDTSRIIASMPAGDYLLWIGPSAWYNMPCDGSGDFGNDYFASIECLPAWLSIDLVSGTINDGDPAIDIDVLMDAEFLEPGVYTGNIKLSANTDNSPIDVPVTFTVNAVFGYVPGDANMSVGEWPPVVNSADVIFLVQYFRFVFPDSPCYFDGFWASADANGDCVIRSADVTYLVAFFRGTQENPPTYCPAYPTIYPTEETYPDCIVLPPTQ